MDERSIAVVFGGPSLEHPVSIRSADGVIPVLLEAGHSVVPIRILRDRRWVFGARLEPRSHQTFVGAEHATDGVPISAGNAAGKLCQQIDVVFPVVHGEFGEDGTLQGLLTALEIPFVGSGVLSSSLCMNKALAKMVVAAETDVHLLPSEVVTRREWDEERTQTERRVARLGIPCVVKPVDCGSSLGVSLAARTEEVDAAMMAALNASPSHTALVEKFATGPEVTCVVGEFEGRRLEALPPILIHSQTGPLFDYEAKYTPGGAEEICPAPLPDSILTQVRSDSCDAFRALRCAGFARFDFVLEGHRPAFLEANTIPGLTKESLLPKSVRAAGWTMQQFLVRVIDSCWLQGKEGLMRARQANG